MNDVKLKPYKKLFDYSYAIGVYPTLELLTYRPEQVLKVLLSSKAFNNSGIEKIKEVCHQQGIKTEISDGFIDKLAGKENCYAVGIFRKYQSQVEQGKNHLVLDGIRDMGNLGTICRTMLGFNINNLAIIRPAADLFDPKAIRASMGAIYQLNFQYFEKFSDYQNICSNNLYSFMTNGKEDLNNVNFKEPYSLIFGSEASGLDDSFQKIGTSVKIKQSNLVDSLNLSVAVGITLYKTQL